MSPAPTGLLSGNTAVTLLASSTANDQISRFNVTLKSLTLISESGKSVTLLSAPQSAEYIHLNGGVEPLTTVTIPQDVYTSATATVEASGPTCVALNSSAGELLTNAAIGLGPASASDVTVNLEAPIRVTGTSMGLALDLQVSQTVGSFNCLSDTTGSASITPVFNLNPVAVAAPPTNSSNGKAFGLQGFVVSVSASGNSFSVTGSDGPTWKVNSNSSTVFQGVNGSAQLSEGMPVDMDVVIQPDGSLMASRAEVYDSDPTNMTIASGPLVQVAASQPTLLDLFVENEGPLFNGLAGGSLPFNFGKATFQVSGQLSNVRDLPFAASFNANNMVAGQRVFASTHASSVSGGPTYIPATTVTLLPQTINGTVSGISSSGAFTTYAVSLAAYDLFPDLAVQPGQAAMLKNPATVVVYTDANTQLLNAKALAVGSVVRFNGLVFNDNGTLRMDCAQVNDGVTE